MHESEKQGVKTKTKMTPKQWLENYWYHYKWATIIGVFFAAVILVSLIQCVTRTAPDVYLMYAGPKALSFSQTDALRISLTEQVMEKDYNGDGVKDAVYLENIIVFDGDYKIINEDGKEEVVLSQTQQVQSYVTQVVAGDAQIYFLSPEIYKELKNESVLVPLATVFGATPSYAYDGSSFILGRLGVYELPGFSDLPADTHVCLRSVKTIGVRSAEAAQREHEWALDIFKSLVQYDNA